MKYPPKYSPNSNFINKSLNFIVNNPSLAHGRPRHRRNISSGYDHVKMNTSRRNQEHGVLLQHKNPIYRLDTEEASNFKDEEIDEAQSQCHASQDFSQQQRVSDSGVYSAKYDYKHFLEQPSKDGSSLNIDYAETSREYPSGFKTYELR